MSQSRPADCLSLAKHHLTKPEGERAAASPSTKPAPETTVVALIRLDTA